MFYRDLVGLRVVDEFRGSYDEDGTIFGLPGTEAHLEIVRVQPPGPVIHTFDQLVFYLPDQAAVDEATAKLLAGGVRPEADQHPSGRRTAGPPSRPQTGAASSYVSWVYGHDPQPSDRGAGTGRGF